MNGKKFISIQELPIVALTANDTLLERQRCIDAGMQSFLSKPPDFLKLKQKLIEIFGNEYSTGFK
jgi:CheY-like chemotaxis protein